MTIRLPKDLESSVCAEVLSGRFASEDDFVATAVRAYLRQQPQQQSAHTPSGTGSIGAMHDNELVDQVTQAIMQGRESEHTASQEPAAGQEAPANIEPQKPVWEKILENMKAVPDDVFDRIPADSSAQLDHYLYGTPKRPTA